MGQVFRPLIKMQKQPGAAVSPLYSALIPLGLNSPKFYF
uniref:Uncharacterized protein n=1 Tax=Anguilla anguilla TaxID=7936 RepID=A0A0E9WEG2_ANGAN